MKFPYAARIAVSFAFGMLAGCGVNGTSGNRVSETSKHQSAPQPARHPSEAHTPAVVNAPTISAHPSARPDTDSLDAFATKGKKILMSATGDLNGDGRIDAVIVVSPPGSDNDKLGEGPARVVMLLVRDEEGQLRRVTQNNLIVPCEMCGGLAGDPFGYIRVAPNGFTVSSGSGSRERWWNEFKFVYSPKLEDWVLLKINRGVSDQLSEESKSETLGPEEFGVVLFSDFDPSRLPELRLP